MSAHISTDVFACKLGYTCEGSAAEHSSLYNSIALRISSARGQDEKRKVYAVRQHASAGTYSTVQSSI